MLKIPSGGGVSPTLAPQAYFNTSGNEAASCSQTASVSYDQLSLSPELGGDRRFQMELISRLSQDVRTAITTGDIQELQRQVSSGEFRPNAEEIASKLLWLGGLEA